MFLKESWKDLCQKCQLQPLLVCQKDLEVATTEESTLQRSSKANDSCSIKDGLDTLKVALIRVAATRRLNNIKVKEIRIERVDCCNDNVNSIPGPRLEAFETPQKRFLVNSCLPNPS